MSTELTRTQNASYVARYNTGPADGYAAFATEGGPGIQGKLLTCAKGDWSIGSNKDPVKEGAQFLAVMPETMRGWLKWLGGKVADADMGYVRDNHLVKHRAALGDLDEAEWEKNPDGTPRDCWSRTYRALFIEMAPPHGDVTYSGSSFGTELALKELCRLYAADRHRYPEGAFPVVTLTTKTRANKNYGNIKGPWFEIAGWADPAEVKAGKKKLATAKVPTKAETEAELDDAVPTSWG